MKNIQLSEEDRAFAEERVRTGPYKNIGDVVHAGLKALRRDETALRQLIQEGLDDLENGNFVDLSDEDDLLAHVRQEANTQR